MHIVCKILNQQTKIIFSKLIFENQKKKKKNAINNDRSQGKADMNIKLLFFSVN